jgi:hypothetical protein
MSSQTRAENNAFMALWYGAKSASTQNIPTVSVAEPAGSFYEILRPALMDGMGRVFEVVGWGATHPLLTCPRPQ